MPLEQETFLIVLTNSLTSFTRAFIWQGTYEDVYKLPHDCWTVSIFLLSPEAQNSWEQYGASLIRVVDLKANLEAKNLVAMAAYTLRRMSSEQRKQELKWIREMLQRESQDHEARVYPDTREGDIQRLLDLDITPLSEEELDRLRRS